jgi:pimeloyl-ACP methyl ester carboxylesterase
VAVLLVVGIMIWPVAPEPGLYVSSDWHVCGDMECATLTAPMDWDLYDSHQAVASREATESQKPGTYTGRRVRIALARIPATDPSSRIGAIVVNPGGPGGSGIDFVKEARRVFPAEILSRFDIVSFDPRGIGESVPNGCVPGRSDTLGMSTCGAELAVDMGTAEVVRDLDAIRSLALGEERISFLGFSYGTVMGVLYADRYPQHVRALVLDGPVDTATDMIRSADVHARAEQKELDAFLSACAADPSCPFYSTGQPGVAYVGLMASLSDASRLKAKNAVIEGLYYDEAGRKRLAADLQDWQITGSPDMLESHTIKVDDSGIYVRCDDMPTMVDGTDEELLNDIGEEAPDFEDTARRSAAACDGYPAAPYATMGPFRAEGSPPALVVGATGDPATPYEWAQSVTDELASAELLTRDGPGHTSYKFSSCIRDAVNGYLIQVQLPPPGTVCR